MSCFGKVCCCGFLGEGLIWGHDWEGDRGFEGMGRGYKVLLFDVVAGFWYWDGMGVWLGELVCAAIIYALYNKIKLSQKARTIGKILRAVPMIYSS